MGAIVVVRVGAIVGLGLFFGAGEGLGEGDSVWFGFRIVG